MDKLFIGAKQLTNTERFIYYLKSVLHLRNNMFHVQLTLVMMRGGTMCPPKVFLFFYQKSLSLTKP